MSQDRGGVAPLQGEPGIAERRTVEQVAAMAVRDPGQVLWGRRRAGAGGQAFLLRLQPLRPDAQTDHLEELGSEQREGATDVAGLISPGTRGSALTGPASAYRPRSSLIDVDE